MRPTRPMQRGFTLVEAVIVMVITGILGGMVAVFIGGPVSSYIASTRRAELTDAADLALRRMARDIRLALPNSIRVVNDGAGRTGLEFLLVRTGGRYWAADDPVAGDFLGFPDLLVPGDAAAAAADLTFDLVGAPPAGRQAIVAGADWLVVNNFGPGLVPADAYNCDLGPCNRALITAVNGNRLTLQDNPFAAQNPVMNSAANRFQVVSTPVSYDCNGGIGGSGRLTRLWNYPITPAQGNPAGGANPRSAILANNVVGCNFEYGNLANTRIGLVGLTLTLQVPGSDDGPITLVHQIHVDGTP